jgi:hypothetical protein
MSREEKTTYGERLDQFKRRERMTVWVSAGLGGLIALMTTGIIADAPALLSSIVTTLIVLGGGSLAMARVKFEWEATKITRRVQDGEIKVSDSIEGCWPENAELYWLTALSFIVLLGCLFIFAVWWRPVVLLLDQEASLVFIPRNCPNCRCGLFPADSGSVARAVDYMGTTGR